MGYKSYSFKVGNSVEGFSKQIMSFWSPKPVGPDTPVSFITYGDLGLGGTASGMWI